MSDNTTPGAKPRRFLRRPGIGLRLVLAQTLVLAAGAAATWAIAAVVGPPLFHKHMHGKVPVNSFLEIHAATMPTDRPPPWPSAAPLPFPR